jgi:PhzF family phenazine biosynthesis protein
MEILRIAAFSHEGRGGNPAGVVICGRMPPESSMLETAREVGYSETAFLAPQDGGWRTRYFAPEMEVAFCGHATIASAAVLGERFGEGSYRLHINGGDITVSASRAPSGVMTAALTSPMTSSEPAPPEYVRRVLGAFGLSWEHRDPAYPVRFAFAGIRHLILVLKERKTLSGMAYDFPVLKALMMEQELITVDLVWVESFSLLHSRNPFPPGGVYEDPATGAAAAALAGYLRDIGWKGGTGFDILQGEDMGCPSRLSVRFTLEKGEGVQVSGETRRIGGEERSRP